MHSKETYLLDVFCASIKDGRGNHLPRKLFVVQAGRQCPLVVKQPTVLLDLALAPTGTPTPTDEGVPERSRIEQALIELALNPFQVEIAAGRCREIDTIARHVEISLNELILRQSLRHADLAEAYEKAPEVPLNAANLKTSEDRLDELNSRLERRQEELQQERQCTIGDIQHVGRAWVLPHPERTAPGVAPMVRDEEIERRAVEFVTKLLEDLGWQVESVEKDNRGFDLIARKPHPEDPKTAIEVRFVEVKGRAGVGEIALSSNEYKTAERLKKDYWLYAVFNCATKPQAHVVQDPARLGWEPLVKIEHYHIGPDAILAQSQQTR